MQDVEGRTGLRTRLEAPARKAVRSVRRAGRLVRGAAGLAVARFQSDSEIGWPNERPDEIERIFASSGINLRHWRIPIEGFRKYLEEADYPDSYHGARRSPEPAFYEKALEHYVSLALAEPSPTDVLVDVASHGGPFSAIARQLYGCTTFQQDLEFPHGVQGDFIGGNAADMPVEDEFADILTLHCSYDHFEKAADIGFAREAGRVLRRGGRVVIVPLYLSDTFGFKTDPRLPRRDLGTDPGMRRFLIPGLQVEFSRLYDPQRLKERVLDPAEQSGLAWDIVRVEGVAEAVPHGYCHWALVLRKPS